MSGKEKKVREKKETTLLLAVIPILAMIVLLGVGYAVMGLSPEVLMLAGVRCDRRSDRFVPRLQLG